MGSRKVILNNLAIPEYPWSSDEEEPVTDQAQAPAPVHAQPREPPIPAPPLPARPPAHAQGQVQVSQLDRDIFWFSLDGPRRDPGPASVPSASRSRDETPLSYMERADHAPAAEYRESSASTDAGAPAGVHDTVQRVLAFRRLTRDLNHYNTLLNEGRAVPYESYSTVRITPVRNRRRAHHSEPRPVRINQRASIIDYTCDRMRWWDAGPADDSDADGEPSAGRQTAPPDVPAASSRAPAPPPEERAPEVPEEIVDVDVEAPDAAPARAHEAAAVAGELMEEVADIPVPEQPPSSSCQIPSLSRRYNNPMTLNTTDPSLASTSRPDEADGPDNPLQQPSHGVKRKRNESQDKVETCSVKQFNQSLLRLLECPVCLEWMEPPMSQCRRGHLVCSRCRTRLASCPVCRTTFSSVRNRAMEGVAEMLRYPCRHGCGREVRLRKRVPHEASCSARKYQCPAPTCQDKLPIARANLGHHFHSKHTAILKLGPLHKFSIKLNSEQHDNWIIHTLEEFFHMKVDFDIGTWGVIVYVVYIGPKVSATDYAYEVTLEGAHSSRRLMYKRATHSDLESSSVTVSRQDCFHLTLDQALNFIRVKNRHCDAEKYLDFNVCISKVEPPPARDESDS